MKNILLIGHGALESPLAQALQPKHQLSSAATPQEALALLGRHHVDLVIFQNGAPERPDLVQRVRELSPHTAVAIVSDQGSRSGEPDQPDVLVPRASRPEHVIEVVERVLEEDRLARHRECLQRELASEFRPGSLVGESGAFRQVIEDANRLSNQSAPVLILGEPGTGKEFLARHMHIWSMRRDEPLVVVRGAGMSPQQAQQLLFGRPGHPAHRLDFRLRGALDLSSHGTLVIEDVNLLPKPAQMAVGDVLRSGKFQRTGGSEEAPCKSRVIVTTSKTLAELRAPEGLDAVLLECCSKSVLEVPPLRDRQEDIPLLAYHLLNRMRQELDLGPRDIEPPAMDLMRRYPWPGNIRELRSVLERLLMVFRNEKAVKEGHLPREFTNVTARPIPDALPMNFEEAVNAFERELIVKALSQTNGVIGRAAELLGTTRRILLYRIDKLKIKKVAE